MPTTPEAVARTWFEEVWNQGSEQAIDRLMAPDAAFHGLPVPVVGPNEFKPFHKSFRNAFPDIHIDIDELVCQGDRVAVKCTVTGTHRGDGLGIAATNRPVTVTGMGMARIENGRIVEAFNTFDFLSLYQQVGLVPTPGR